MIVHCPWCDDVIHPEQDWSRVNGRRWHAECAEAYWAVRYESFASGVDGA